MHRWAEVARHRLLIVSDVDGTLLDEFGALPCTARELRADLVAVQSALSRSISVGFASSRTLSELVVLQRALSMRGPCIAEDGAVVAVDACHAMDTPVGIEPLVEDRETLRAGRRVLRTWCHPIGTVQLREWFLCEEQVAHAASESLADDDLHARSLRTVAARRRALHDRTHSLLLASDRVHDAALLRATAERRGVALRHGGQWTSLSAAGDKGDGLRALRHIARDCGVESCIIVAIGNEANDESLLAAADVRFVIRNPRRGPHPALAALPGAIVLDTDGPGGWMEMLARLRELRA